MLTGPFLHGRDCEGPRAAGVATTTSAAAVQDEETATPSFPPPTESVGCVAHGDHYDCSGPANTASTANTAATASPAVVAAAEEGDDHNGDHEGETPPFPPPTESVGCRAHGDHYDCSGPAAVAQVTAPPTASGAVAGTNGTSVVPFQSASTTPPPTTTTSGSTAGTNGTTTVVPFEGAAGSSRVISLAAVTGLLGIVCLALAL